jgi:hypothetical protein
MLSFDPYSRCHAALRHPYPRDVAESAKETPVKYMATYDLMESIRNTNEWMGASARAMASYPAFALSLNPMLQLMA